jgi:hypothetical protein
MDSLECILEHNAIRKIRLEMDKPDIGKIVGTFGNITKTANFKLYKEHGRTCLVFETNKTARIFVWESRVLRGQILFSIFTWNELV